MWFGKLTALDMTPLGCLGHKTSTQTKSLRSVDQGLYFLPFIQHHLDTSSDKHMDFSKFNVRMVSGKVSFEDNLHEMHHQAYFLRKIRKIFQNHFTCHPLKFVQSLLSINIQKNIDTVDPRINDSFCSQNELAIVKNLYVKKQQNEI